MGETKNKFPQFVVRFLGLEQYDPETGEWVDIAEYAQEIAGYFVLFNQEKAIKYDCVQAAFNWDGADFRALQDGDYSETVVQIEVEDNEYMGKTNKKVEWVDAADANPTRTLTPMEPTALKAMATKYAHMMNAGKASKPAPAKPKKAPAAPKARKPKPEPEAETGQGVLPNETTKEEAWEFLLKNRGRDVSDESVSDAFVEGCDAVYEVEEKDEDDFTAADWATVRNVAMEKLAIVPF
jgi:hypothetical protein